MYGNNPIRPPVKGGGTTLEVQSIFKTFQGEGPYTGWPAIFIRLGGCNLACSFCDTEFESYKTWALKEIFAEVATLNKNNTHNLVVITGGEPFRQPIEQLCEYLVVKGYKVQIETNGTLYRPIHEKVDIICSPKNTGTGYNQIRGDLLKRISAFKFIVSASNKKYTNIPALNKQAKDIPIYVQPMDEYNKTKNQKNLQLAVQYVEQHGYKLSLQTHKIAGVE